MAHRVRSAPPFTSLRAECQKDAAGQGGFGSVMTSPSAEMNAFSSCHRESIVAESNDTFLIFSKLRLGRILQKGSYLARGEWVCGHLFLWVSGICPQVFLLSPFIYSRGGGRGEAGRGQQGGKQDDVGIPLPV